MPEQQKIMDMFVEKKDELFSFANDEDFIYECDATSKEAKYDTFRNISAMISFLTPHHNFSDWELITDDDHLVQNHPIKVVFFGTYDRVSTQTFSYQHVCMIVDWNVYDSCFSTKRPLEKRKLNLLQVDYRYIMRGSLWYLLVPEFAKDKKYDRACVFIPPCKIDLDDVEKDVHQSIINEYVL